MKVLQHVTDHASGGTYGWLFWCPGCEQYHCYRTSWQFNGDEACPTFSPSLLNTWEEGKAHTAKRCHLFVEQGTIKYCGDCTHPLAGQTVAMVDINDLRQNHRKESAP